MAPDIKPEADATPVVIDGRTILLARSFVGGFSPAESRNKQNDMPVSLIHAKDSRPWTEILAGDQMIRGAELDERTAGRAREQLAVEDAEVIRQVVTLYRFPAP